MGRQNPVARIDPDTCVDFSTHGNIVTDKFREGWERIFGKQEKRDGKESERLCWAGEIESVEPEGSSGAERKGEKDSGV